MSDSAPIDPALGHPLLRQLRRDHPDVDIVILPEAVPAPESEAIEVVERARLAIAESRLVMTELLDVAGRPDAPTVEIWSSHDRTGSRRRIVRTAIHPLAEGEAVPLLRELGDALLERGWDARPYADGSPRLAAGQGDLVVQAEALPTAVRIEVTSIPFPLSDASASELEATR